MAKTSKTASRKTSKTSKASRKVAKKTSRKPRLTKRQKLVQEVSKRGSMTHKQIVQFLLRGTGNKYGPDTRKYYDSYLYGTADRLGVFQVELVQSDDGTYRKWELH